MLPIAVTWARHHHLRSEREQQQCREAGVRYFWTKPATVDAREGQQGVRELLAEYRLWAAQQDVSPDL